MNPSPTSSPFQFANFGSQPPPQQQQQQQQQQLQQQQQFQHQQFQQMPGLVAPHIHLRSTDGTPLSYQAKWSDIHDDTKNLLLAIEAKMLEYRDESRRLDQCQRLYDSAALHKGFELESVRISQELGGVGAAVVIEQSSLEEMIQTAKVLMRNAEVAVRSFMMLRHHFSRLKVPAVAPAGSTPSAGPLALGFSHTPSTAAPAAPPPGPTADFYSGIPSKPSQFLQQTVSRFDAQLSEYGQRIEELERLLQDGNAGQVNGRSSSELSLLQSLPTVMTNVHDFFIHVAAEVESLHQQIEAMRIALIADRRRRGDDMNPFLEADRREVAKREVAAKRVHPTLNGPMTPLATHMPGMDPRAAQTPVPFGAAGSAQSMPSSAAPLFGSAQGTPSMFAPSSAAAQFTPSTVAPTVGSGSFSTFSMFGASTPSSSIFGANTGTPAGSTPASNLFGAGTATSLFGGSPATPFGTFGQNQASGPKQMARATTSATPLFSMANTPTAATPLFGATPTVQTPLFGTPASGTGAAAAVKPKPRGPRRK